MNEVRKIHLGRQAFTIATDAYKALQDYLHAIQTQVDDTEVVSEVEARMAELLTERGLGDEKVVLAADVAYLKEQLGKPEDFTEEGEQDSKKQPMATSSTKRLFRDTDNAMIAGVASGLGQYFGIDALVFRLLFIMGVFTGGWGIVLYLLLWLLVPEAKTSSERLQMAGKPVTVNSLKEAVARADVPGAARRANSVFMQVLVTSCRVALRVIGMSLVLFGLLILLALFTSIGYVLMHPTNLLGQDIFPVGLKEHLLLYITGAVAALITLFLIIFGLATFKRKWPVTNWVVGTLIGLLLIGTASSLALGADVAPQVRDRYNTHVHTTTRVLQPFSSVTTIGDGVAVNFIQSSTYAVQLKYFDNPDINDIKTTVTNKVLTIDSSSFDWHRHCAALCIPDTYDVIVFVYTPDPPADPGLSPMPPTPIESQ